MKRITLVAIVVVSFAAYAVADEVSFNFTVGLPGSVVASPAGLTAGPSMLTSISDSNTMVNIPFTGSLVNANAGPAINFTLVGDIAIIVFSPSGANSVLVEDSLSNVLVAGSMRGGSTLLSTIPPLTGTGAFLGTFDVSFVDPAILALLGQTSFLPIGSVAFTTGNATFDPTTSTLTATIGGGAVTIETLVPEPASLGLVGMGLLAVVGAVRLKKRTHRTPR